MKKLVALVGAGLLMAACSANPSAAAEVNGETITIAELAQVQDDFQDNGVNSLADGVLNMMINAEVANEVIADAGLSVPEEMRQTVFSQLGLNPEGEYSAATEEMIDFLAFTLVVRQGLYTADEITPVLTALGEAEVEVNPRFGTWDSENFAIAPLIRDYVTSEQPSL